MGNRSMSKLIKSRWSSEGGDLSLKSFARKLAADGEQLAKDWLDHKKGSLNQGMSDTNRARIQLEKQATKLSRSKKKSNKKDAAKEPAIAKGAK
jgi:Ulp1 family protease